MCVEVTESKMATTIIFEGVLRPRNILSFDPATPKPSGRKMCSIASFGRVTLTFLPNSLIKIAAASRY